ncbi:coagulation factor V [Lampris incognitus]|uniref:coagulation factor V n=1 Tax=Lampris incognitus TaxID=2546036 RepID=UPI0024B5EE56|nr:coagulation factor V [Lampris incognitus]
MRLCSCAGPPCLLLALLLLLALHGKANQETPQERHYYIAAVQIDWHYSGNGSEGPTYRKVVFREYEKNFTQPKPHPSWLGLQGPVLRGQQGDTILVTFKNMADRPYSVHAHGIAYGKQSEGAQYFDNTSLKEKEDDVVRPNDEHTYHWEVTSDIAPERHDPACLTYTYVSHLHVVQDYNAGLIGTLLICKPGSLDETGEQVQDYQEYALLFGVFDENKSWYKPTGYSADNHVKHTINGYTRGSLPGVSLCAHTAVSLHLAGMSSEPEVFSVHMNGQVLLQTGHKVSSVGLISGTTATASVTAIHPGRWLLSSQVGGHLQAGMYGFVDVKKCEGCDAPKRRLTMQQKHECKEWTYYIAAEEIIWNYAPLMPPFIDKDYKLQYLTQGPTRIGGQYKKVVYTQYTNETFTKRKEEKQRKAEVGILGPVIRAQIRDVVKVVFKNMASRPYSIYPHGLTIEKSEEGFNYPAGGNHTHAVQPGQTHTYTWKVNEVDEPMDGDSRCLTRLYHSAVDTTRDIASGLVGPLLICKTQSLSVRNVQMRADKEQHAVFTVFDENKSWYLDQNIRSYCDRAKVNKADPHFYKSNVMHTINGYAFESGPTLGFCNGEIATWHVSSIGALDNIQTVTFYGHAFEVNDRTEDFLSLYPMTGETIFMDMDNIGVWLLASLNTHETTKGMRVKFRDVECFRDFLYEYSDYENYELKTDLSLWTPPSIDELKKKEQEKKKEKLVTDNTVELDYYTGMLADELGFRSFRNSAGGSDMEELDLSFLDYDAVPEGVVNTTSDVKRKMGNNTIVMSKNITNNSQYNTTTEFGGFGFISNETSFELEVESGRNTTTGDDSMSTTTVKNHTFSNEFVSGNLSSYSGNSQDNSSAELISPDSVEEVIIYLKDNKTEVIKTTSLNSEQHNWTYKGRHQSVPMEMSDHMIKYIGDDSTPRSTPIPTKKPIIKKVNRRMQPKKGKCLKTKKRKQYKPQVKRGHPISPEVSDPGISPRGARPASFALQPISNEEDLINMPVVIGVPRPDFSDYELYVPEDTLQLRGLDPDVAQDEYEYISYNDPYSNTDDIKTFTLDETTKYYLKLAGDNYRIYFISAEEVTWDYAGYGQRRQEKVQTIRETKFTKVVFRGYLDSTFSTPEIRGEIEEHLGILGPVIKAEVGESIMIVFRNNANRPYSLHPKGVSYSKQAEGLSYEDDSNYWHKYDNDVQPNTTFTYLWKVQERVGPTDDESYCRTWAYYSGVNPERDIHSGLIGPLLVCRNGTLERNLVDMREFMLLFMIFDESKSWYYEKNRETIQRRNGRNGRRGIMDPNFRENLKFHSINGIVYSLKGLRMYTNQLVRWHLINMGSNRGLHSVYFHGQTFLHKHTHSYRQAIYPLLPGGSATLEMWPSKPGLWQMATNVGFDQQRGMQTLFLVLDNNCYHPLGLETGSVKDRQITANNTRGYWEPHFARLNNQGKYNAWSTDQQDSWIQVDFLRPVVISQIATQGAKQMFHSQFVQEYIISYSIDRRGWTFYKGDSKDFRKTFTGNEEAYETKLNTFFPPLIGRFIRLHPRRWYNTATVRMEFYGCELDGCSVPLGLESRLIEDHRITASSTYQSWYFGTWRPSLARLDTQGAVNAWQAKYNDLNQWLQVELPQVRKITGIITQGAKILGKEMYVITYLLQYSVDGVHWTTYTDDKDYMSKTFTGNTDNNDHVRNYIYPPIFSRFIRIVPQTWRNAITLRVELLGCDAE